MRAVRELNRERCVYHSFKEPRRPGEGEVDLQQMDVGEDAARQVRGVLSAPNAGARIQQAFQRGIESFAKAVVHRGVSKPVASRLHRRIEGQHLIACRPRLAPVVGQGPAVQAFRGGLRIWKSPSRVSRIA